MTQQLHLVVGAEHALVEEAQELLGGPASGDGRVCGGGTSHFTVERSRGTGVPQCLDAQYGGGRNEPGS